MNPRLVDSAIEFAHNAFRESNRLRLRIAGEHNPAIDLVRLLTTVSTATLELLDAAEKELPTILTVAQEQKTVTPEMAGKCLKALFTTYDSYWVATRHGNGPPFTATNIFISAGQITLAELLNQELGGGK